jgi:phosphate transport system substrate-binding protein
MNRQIPAMVKRLSLAIASVVVAFGVQAAERIKIDGSSTVYPITEAMAEEFQIVEKGKTQVTVGVSGTGGGFKKFCRGDIQIANASRPIKAQEREQCKQKGIRFVEIPVALDALAVLINPKNDWVDHLTIDELKTLYQPESQGNIMFWNQVRADFPKQPIRLFGAGVESGTYDYFTKAVVGKEHASRGDFTASEDDNVLVQGIARDVNAIGFFGYAYYHENKDKLKAVPISYKDQTAVMPSPENARSGAYQPLSRPIFIYVSLSEPSEALKRFVAFYLNAQNATTLVSEVGYVALPKEAYGKAYQNFLNEKTGSAFAGGSKVGVSIDELLIAKTVD